MKARYTVSSQPQRIFPTCRDHKAGDWNEPALAEEPCILCRLFYLEAQESLLEEWQQRAKRAEDALAEVQRPLDAQMARLNETVTRLNAENDQLRRAASETPLRTPTWVSPTDREPDLDGRLWVILVERRENGKRTGYIPTFEYYHFIDGWATDDTVLFWLDSPLHPLPEVTRG